MKEKNLDKHGVANEECEEVFFDPHKQIVKQVFVSGKEERYVLVGSTREARDLFIVFTIRKRMVRVISARNLSRRERRLYEKES